MYFSPIKNNRMYIYTIKSKSNDFFIYIGSTTQPLNYRWSGHKIDCKRKTSHLYNFILNNGGIDNFYIELYEKFNGTKEELRKREGEIIKEFKKLKDYYVVNHKIECRNKRQYYLDNKEKKLKYQKEYYQKNKQKRIKYQRDYYKKNKK